MILRDLKKTSQEGWQLKDIYTMELFQELKGHLPLVEVGSGKIVGCTNREDLKRIWEILPQKEVKVCKYDCLVNEKEKLMIPLDFPKGDETSSDSFLLISGNIKEHLGKTIFMYYLPGLILLKEESKAKFPEE